MMVSKNRINKSKSNNQTQQYRGNGNHDWETVTTDTERLRVPGGWLYRDTYEYRGMVFVPMPEVVKYAI